MNIAPVTEKLRDNIRINESHISQKKSINIDKFKSMGRKKEI